MVPTLAEEWADNNDRLRWVAQNRHSIEEAADVSIPRNLGAMDEWLQHNKHVVTKHLQNENGDDTDTDAGADPGADEEADDE